MCYMLSVLTRSHLPKVDETGWGQVNDKINGSTGINSSY